MHVDQRQVTIINLHDGRTRDFVLHRENRGYKLSLVSKDDVVHVLLSPQDLQKLRQELGCTEPAPHQADYRPAREPAGVAPTGHEHYGYQWGTLDWLSYN